MIGEIRRKLDTSDKASNLVEISDSDYRRARSKDVKLITNEKA